MFNRKHCEGLWWLKRLPWKYLRLKVFLLYCVAVAFWVLVQIPHCFLRNRRTLWTLYIHWWRLDATACKQGCKSTSGMMHFCFCLVSLPFLCFSQLSLLTHQESDLTGAEGGLVASTCHGAGHEIKAQLVDRPEIC